jgi:hypothetical protein
MAVTSKWDYLLVANMMAWIRTHNENMMDACWTMEMTATN